MRRTKCPTCGSDRCFEFYSVSGVPTNSCLLISDQEQALKFPTGDIELSSCRECGFIFNSVWEPQRTIYSERYEETQGFSSTFNAFSRQLAEELVERHDLRGKDVLEIGCGKGEFLKLLCELGDNRGIGYDPSFVPERQSQSAASIRFVRELFDEDTVEHAVDLICCKMTLEHIAEPQRFIRTVRRAASAERGTIVFFQIPDVRRILHETAFWDIYYEHCSYFAPSSLARVFRSSGFEVLRISTGYDDQYLMIEARAANGRIAEAIPPASEAAEIDAMLPRLVGFANAQNRIGEQWVRLLRAWAATGRRTVLWGSGSKAVAFLTTLRLRDDIELVVDVNPYRHGRFMPGTGQRIVAPSFLASYQPDVVVIMNPVYRREITQDLARHECYPQTVDVNDVWQLVGVDGVASPTGREPRME